MACPDRGEDGHPPHPPPAAGWAPPLGAWVPCSGVSRTSPALTYSPGAAKSSEESLCPLRRGQARRKRRKQIFSQIFGAQISEKPPLIAHLLYSVRSISPSILASPSSWNMPQGSCTRSPACNTLPAELDKPGSQLWEPMVKYPEFCNLVDSWHYTGSLIRATTEVFTPGESANTSSVTSPLCPRELVVDQLPAHHWLAPSHPLGLGLLSPPRGGLPGGPA